MSRAPSNDIDNTRLSFLRFADYEAKGVSPLYEEFSRAVAQSQKALAVIASLPAPKRQPNLIFASVRAACGLADEGVHFCELLLEHQSDVLAIAQSRSTQTNEPACCATLLPLLCALPQPLALLEVGASAGLCLFPDLYNYRYSNGCHLVGSAKQSAPNFDCEISGPAPMPNDLPTVVWRAGIDLNPLDRADAQTAEWLQLLVWPEQTARAKNLAKAISVTSRADVDVDIHKGNLLTDVPGIADRAPTDATLVIFHSAVLAYVTDAGQRANFAKQMQSIDGHWISNEHPLVFPQISDKLAQPPNPKRFLLNLDGEPVAEAGPHGQSLSWLNQ